MPDLATLQARMRPGEYSSAGFLGPDESLEAVLAADAVTFAELGVTPAALADQLERWLVAASRGQPDRRGGRSVVIGTATMRLVATRGAQTCPWADRRSFGRCAGHERQPVGGSMTWTLDDPENGLQLAGGDLAVHLLRSHGFCQDHGTPYRLDPRTACRAFGLGPEAISRPDLPAVAPARPGPSRPSRPSRPR
jgi:hypothetical protein